MSSPSSHDPSDPSARDKIVPVIARVFRRFGYEAASLSLLSKETGLGRSSLYHFFPGGKEEMAEAVLARAERTLHSDLMGALTAPDTPERQVANFIAKLSDYYEGGTVGCLFSVLTLHDSPPAIGARVAELTEQWIAALAAYLEAYGNDDPKAKAEQAIRLVEGGLVVALATRRPERFESALEELAALLLNH